MQLKYENLLGQEASFKILLSICRIAAGAANASAMRTIFDCWQKSDGQDRGSTLKEGVVEDSIGY